MRKRLEQKRNQMVSSPPVDVENPRVLVDRGLGIAEAIKNIKTVLSSDHQNHYLSFLCRRRIALLCWYEPSKRSNTLGNYYSRAGDTIYGRVGRVAWASLNTSYFRLVNFIAIESRV
jgi:hypothetical protein